MWTCHVQVKFIALITSLLLSSRSSNCVYFITLEVGQNVNWCLFAYLRTHFSHFPFHCFKYVTFIFYLGLRSFYGSSAQRIILSSPAEINNKMNFLLKNISRRVRLYHILFVLLVFLCVITVLYWYHSMLYYITLYIVYYYCSLLYTSILPYYYSLGIRFFLF